MGAPHLAERWEAVVASVGEAELRDYEEPDEWLREGDLALEKRVLRVLPTPGHTRGHACVAVDAGDRWVLHCGDAFYHRGTVDGRSRVPFPLRAMESLVAFDRGKVHSNHARLAELYRRAEPDLVVVCAHDPVMYEAMRAGS